MTSIEYLLATRRQLEMARPKTAYRNSIKSAVDDETYDGIRRYMQAYGVEIEARAISDLLKFSVRGMVGIVPPDLIVSTSSRSISGTKTHA